MFKYLLPFLIALALTFGSLFITTTATFNYGNECYEINIIDNWCHYAVKAKGYPLGMLGDFTDKPVPSSHAEIDTFEGFVINFLFYFGVTSLIIMILSDLKRKFHSDNRI